MVDSTDFAQVMGEADDIARSVSQKLTSAHLLLAMYTVENRAQLLLRERGVDEDIILSLMTAAPQEDEGLVRELADRAREIAQGCGCIEADCLHALIAVTRLRCCAQDLLSRAGLDLTSLRNTALSYYLSGRMPRRLQLGRELPGGVPRAPSGRPIGAPPVPLQQRPAAKTATLSPAPVARPILSPRDLVDEVAEREAEPEPALAEAAAPEPQPEPAKAPPRPLPSPPRPASSPGKSLAIDPRRFPLLASLGRNLSLSAQEGRLDPVVGRAKEIDEVIDILGKRRTNNPCLVGEPGVGKTAIVEGVAQQLLTLKGPLAEKIVVELDMPTLLAGTQLRGSFSEKLNGLKDEVKRAGGRVVVFIDEIHTLVGAGATADGPQDAANELKSAMSRGEFPCIGATTHDEFRKHIQPDPALERRFTPVVVKEPSVPETVRILQGVIGRYEEHHRLRYSAEALQASASLAARYVSDRFLPDKAISIADLAGSRCRREGKGTVEPGDVARVVAKLAGIPEERLLMTDSARLMRLEDDLRSRVVGHQEVQSRIARVIRRNYAGFASRRPMGSFLFLGPTGVGKTELSRALAEVLFGSRDAMVRVDMSELSESHGVSRLIGAPAGYVGYGDGGQLTEPVRRRPSSVVVLDEIDKASREVLMLMLQVLEEGRLTDGKGRHIDFSNTVVVMTTNLGSEAFGQKGRPLGFASSDSAPSSGAQVDETAACEAARRALPPELWNRIDERCIFRPLEELEVARIAFLLLSESSQRLASEKGIEYVADQAVVELLMKSGGFDPKLGARPMRQLVQRMVEAPLAERILQGEFGRGDRVRVGVAAGQLAFVREGRS
ncbi:MAG: ATP-dependent Clp protease ATP-binding subunit [Myxococcales bacterium]|nr:ATP-dependent Clp protease ATP-binding subunit [Myxococcales bacterium]